MSTINIQSMMLKPELPSRTFISDHRLSSEFFHDSRDRIKCLRKQNISPVKSMRIAQPNHGTNYDSPNGPLTPVCISRLYIFFLYLLSLNLYHLCDLFAIEPSVIHLFRSNICKICS